MIVNERLNAFETHQKRGQDISKGLPLYHHQPASKSIRIGLFVDLIRLNEQDGSTKNF